MATKYRIKAGYREYKQLITLIGPGEAVNLIGEPVKKIVPAEGTRLAYETEVRGATQEDLEKLFSKKHPLIEEYDDTEDTKKVTDAGPVGNSGAGNPKGNTSNTGTAKGNTPV